MNNKNVRLFAGMLCLLLFPLFFTNCATKKVASAQTTTVAANTHEDHSQTDTQANKRQDRNAFREHIVKQGESISVIARQYKVTVDSIVALNQIENADLIQVGQKLKIPEGVSPAK